METLRNIPGLAIPVMVLELIMLLLPPKLNDNVDCVYYSHKERQNGASDHSVMIIEFR